MPSHAVIDGTEQQFRRDRFHQVANDAWLKAEPRGNSIIARCQDDRDGWKLLPHLRDKPKAIAIGHEAIDKRDGLLRCGRPASVSG